MALPYSRFPAYIFYALNADKNEDHCVSLCGYGTISWLAQQMKFTVPHGVDGTKPGYALFAWGCVGIIDFPSLLADHT